MITDSRSAAVMCEPCPPQKCASEAWCRSFDRRKQPAYLGLWWEPPALRAQDGGMRVDPATVAPPARFRPSCLSRSAAATLAVVRWGGRRAQNSRLRRSFAVRVVDHPVQRFCPRQCSARHRRRRIGTQPARRPHTLSARVVPALQPRGRIGEDAEGGRRVEQVPVVPVLTIEMLSGQLQPQTAGEGSGTVA